MSGSSLLKAARSWYARHRGAATRGFLIALFPTLILLWILEPATMVHGLLKGEAYQPDAAYVGFRIAKAYGRAPPDVLLLGGSSLRETTPDRRDADSWLSVRCGRSVRVFNAATSSQHPSDGWAIADAIGGAPRVVVIGLSYHRLMRAGADDTYDPNAQTVALPRSPVALRQSLVRGDLRGGLFDFFAQFERAEWAISALRDEAAGRGETGNPVRDNDDRDVSLADPIAAEAKRYMADQMYVLAGDDLKRSSAEMTEYWLGFAREMRRRGSRPLFVMTPYSEEAGALAREYSPSTTAALARLARENPVLDLRNHPHLGAADFTDPAHLSDAGRRRAWPILGEAIAEAYGCPSITGGV